MVTYLNILALTVLGILFQVSIFPAYLADPFKPNILIIFIAYLGFRVSMPLGACSAFLLGLIQDSFSGFCFGLNGFSYLLIYFLFHETTVRLYTESRLLIVLGAFLACLLNGLIQLLLLALFSEAQGVYLVIFQSLLPHSVMTSAVAAVSCLLFSPKSKESLR